jgi:hypothetical protein
MKSVQSMKAQLGNLTWLQRCGGRMAWHERLRFIGQAVQVQFARKFSLARSLPLPYRDLDEITPPDSAITREALALCFDSSDAYLVNHCLRTYYWARLLDDGRQRFDDEALFTAVLLHDLGLTQDYRLPESSPLCFTVAGAQAAYELALKHNWDDVRATRTADAIALHLNIHIADEQSKEARMLRAGAGADVIGAGLRQLDASQIQTLHTRIPRLDMGQQLVQVLKQEAQLRPCCRMALLHKQLGFLNLIHHHDVRYATNLPVTGS